MRNISIASRIFLVLLLPVAAMVALGILVNNGYRAEYRNQRVGELRRHVDNALATLSHAREAAAAEGASADEALDRGFSAVEAMRFGEGDYFFIIEGSVVRAHGGNPARRGRDLGNVSDANGFNYIREMERLVAAEGAGVVEYWRERPNADEPEPKLSFVRGIEGTRMYIGTGVYIDDLAVVESRMLFKALMITAATAVVVAGLGFFIARSVIGPLGRLSVRMADVAAGDLDAPVTETEARDEIGAMARSLEVFREQSSAMRKLESDQHRADMELQRRQMLDDLSASFGAIVAAGADGDFTQRIDKAFEDPALKSMAAGLNTLLDNVESGLASCGAVLSALARGDLTERMDGDHHGAFREMQANTNDLVDRLRDMLGGLRTLTNRISTDVTRIAESAQDLSSRSESQAASLEETAATMGEIAETVKDNAKHSTDATARSDGARIEAGKGSQVVAEAIDAMKGIHEGSAKIAEIVSVIDGFAFQTNLLALNAAVEAARAGEAGKGFAVVASEVRSLAQRSAEAARDIKGLIDESGRSVSDGVRLVENTGTALTTLATATEDVVAVVAAISKATQEQSSGVSEISAAISSLDRINQENAALADQSASTATSLAENCARLTDAMARFQLDRAGATDRMTRSA